MSERIALYLQDKHDIREGMEYVKYAEERGFEAASYVEVALAVVRAGTRARRSHPPTSPATRELGASRELCAAKNASPVFWTVRVASRTACNR